MGCAGPGAFSAARTCEALDVWPPVHTGVLLVGHHHLDHSRGAKQTRMASQGLVTASDINLYIICNPIIDLYKELGGSDMS